VSDARDPHRGLTAVPSRIVIVGAGLAGLRAAQAARTAGHEGELVLLGAEPHAPYTRPPLSKELLRGERTAAECALPGLDALDAELRLSTEVTGVDPEAHTLTLGDATRESYDRLIVATGSRARALPTSQTATGVLTLRDLADAERVGDVLAHSTHLAIIGAGFIGCEVAASARTRGVEVTLIDSADQPLPPLGPELGARIAQLHRDHGVTLRLGVGVQSTVDGEVRLTDGTTVTADHVLLAVGATLNTDFLAGSGIGLDPAGGVICDATLTSVSDPDILAAGDVAAWPHPGAGGERVRVEHWTTAAEHGRLAGVNATLDPSQRTAHTAPPYVWSDQYDCKIQSAGFPGRAARIEIVEEDRDADPPRLVAEAYDGDGELVGAVTFNQARRCNEYRRRLIAEYA
jgi:3-phenylpropionate/trans-cinnamate dioxygenase ferredoxin reductase subunit